MICIKKAEKQKYINFLVGCESSTVGPDESWRVTFGLTAIKRNLSPVSRDTEHNADLRSDLTETILNLFSVEVTSTQVQIGATCTLSFLSQGNVVVFTSLH